MEVRRPFNVLWAPLGCTPEECPEKSLDAWRCAALQCAPGTPRVYTRGVSCFFSRVPFPPSRRKGTSGTSSLPTVGRLRPQGVLLLMRPYVTLASVLEQGLVVQLSAGEEGAGVLRSRCSGSLTERIQTLHAALAPHRLTFLNGGVPAPVFFRGDHKDVSKLYALGKLASLIKENGSVLWSVAVALLRQQRSAWLEKINATLPADAQLCVSALHSTHTDKRRGNLFAVSFARKSLPCSSL